MLRISKLADYATTVMVCLAKHPSGLNTAKTIASQTHLSLPTVSKLLKLLNQAGLLHSQRGAQGGYQLAKRIENISMLAIIQAVEGNTGVTECSIDEGDCHLESVCQVTQQWQRINRRISDMLDNVYLAEFVAEESHGETI